MGPDSIKVFFNGMGEINTPFLDIPFLFFIKSLNIYIFKFVQCFHFALLLLNTVNDDAS